MTATEKECPTCGATVEIEERGRFVWHTRPDQNALDLRTGKLSAVRCPKSWQWAGDDD